MDIDIMLGEWYPLLRHVFAEPWMIKLGQRLFEVRDKVTPPMGHMFRAFKLCPPSKVKVVIIGQDPYINGEADGLAFSSYWKLTPSLEVVFEEINRTHLVKRTQTHLDDWATQGVLLLNSVLTTNIGKSKAHEGWGWELFVDQVMCTLYQLKQPIVVFGWGRDAQIATRGLQGPGNADRPRLYLKACHPQAQNWNPNNKFVGCNHFIECNQFLVDHGLSPIWWTDPFRDAHKDGDSWYYYVEHFYLKSKTHVKVDFTTLLHSYPAVPDKPHPYYQGLGSGHSDTLPF